MPKSQKKNNPKNVLRRKSTSDIAEMRKRAPKQARKSARGRKSASR